VNPIKVGPPVMDYGTGTMGAFAIASALFQRTRTGRGQHIDMAMFDVALMLMSADVTTTLKTGRSPKPMGNDYPLAGTRCYPTADGLLMIGAMNRRQHARLFELLGRPDIAAVSDYAPRFDAAGEQAEFLRALFATRPAAEWEDHLQKHGIPAARVRALDEALADPQLAARAVTHTFAEGPDGKPLTVPLAAFKLEHGGARIDSPPPTLGEHTDAVLADLGYGAAEIAALRRDGVV
jgi:crotonobetainyl-CoA:carnitine CoA-transferase CaiB-like acyl-CoA transferase